MSGIKQVFDDNHVNVPPDGWQQNTLDVLERLHRDLHELPPDVKVIGRGSHGLVVDHTDGSVSKLFFKGAYDRSYIENLFDDEVRILDLLQDRQFGTARTPALQGSLKFGDMQEAVATYRMTKFEGYELNWERFIQTAQHEDIERHFRNV